MKYCGNCGKQISDDAIFCAYCGTKTNSAVERRTCPECGSEITDGQLFCPNCGTVQAQESKKATVEVNDNSKGEQKTVAWKKKGRVEGWRLLLSLDMLCMITIFGIPVAIYGLFSLYKANNAQTDYEARAIMKKATKVSAIGFIICFVLYILIMEA